MTEVRKRDGSSYPPRTIHLILAGLQRLVQEVYPDHPKFFNQADSPYRDLRRTCDTIYRGLRGQGIGTEINIRLFSLRTRNNCYGIVDVFQ